MNQLGDSKQIIKREARVRSGSAQGLLSREGRMQKGGGWRVVTMQNATLEELRRLLQWGQRGEERTAEGGFHGRLWCKSERTLAAEMQSRARAMEEGVEDGQGG